MLFLLTKRGKPKWKTKRLIREKILRNLNSLDRVEHRERSIRLAEKLFLLPEWENAKVVGITLARHPEIETEAIILQAKKRRENHFNSKNILS